MDTQNIGAQSTVQHLQTAIQVAVENVQSGNGGPFGAVIITPDGQVFSSGNSVTTTNDPTAHAEVNTIRKACEALGTFDLSGSILYSSCEPCPMCLASTLWARIDTVYFAANRDDAADAGFDDRAFYELFGLSAGQQLSHVKEIQVDNKVAPFDAWSEHASRIEY